MAYVLKKLLASIKNYGSKRLLSKIKWLVIHATMNDGDTDEANGKYFSKPVTPRASAHYFVDDDSVTQSVPDDHVAFSVGGSKYNNGGGRLYGIVTNTNSLSIELCDDVKNGVVYPSQGIIDNAIMHAKKKMVEHGIDKAHVIRHYDVNGKPCPAYWVDDAKWKSVFWNKLCGWVQIGTDWYWLDDDGKTAKSDWRKISGLWYWFDSTGKMTKGWKELAWNGEKAWYYFDPEDGDMIYSKWIVYSGCSYYLDKSGVMATNCYVKSTSKNIYYWVNANGVWEPQWDTATPNLKKYRLVE